MSTATVDRSEALERQRAAEHAHAAWRPKHNPWLIALTVTMATFMEVLDTSIANVALPHIGGNLSASQDESTWILTSYLVSNAIILPVSAWLATTFGRKRFYMTCVALFGASSFLCGFAPSLGALVFFRILQGFGGGGLAPSEQAILADTFPPARRGMAFAVYGMAVVCAPAIGPTLGGWITDNYSWRWIFYINVPIAILSLILTQRMVEDPPYLLEERKRVSKIGVDFPGLGLIALGIGCLQVVLDKGQEADWFATWWIIALSITAAVSLVVFVIWEWNHDHPIVDVKLFKLRNFSTTIFFTFMLGMVLFGSTVLIPQFLQTLLGYPAVKAGEALSGGGAIMIVMMPLAGMLVSRMDQRLMIAIGFASTALSLLYLTHLYIGIDFGTVAMMRIYQTLGLAFIFLPSNTLAYLGVPRVKNNQVSGINSFARNIGGSIGIAVLSTLLIRQAQRHLTYLSAHTYPGNPAFDSMVRNLSGAFMRDGHVARGPFGATQQAYKEVFGMMQAQASNLAYIDVISGMAVLVACLIPFVFLMKRPPKQAGDERPAAH
ncbi:MAG TPA: DHA2 family efflux MFS transporter permease subunit [Bryobacteraceae bacterium]|nr:DHA2 family efflux MFS transporter permease subunit [Bryobacteraceae bacterium]